MTEYRSKLNELLAKKRSADDRLRASRQELIDAADSVAAAEMAQMVLQSAAQAVQQEAHHRIADLVSRCLETIFDDPYEFRIVFEQKRGKTEARLVFVRDGMELDPLGSAGGGVVDVAAFALRLSCLMLVRPPLRRILILDEPFRFVSAEYRPRLRALILQLADELGVQFIMVTHIQELKCGSVVTIGDES